MKDIEDLTLTKIEDQKCLLLKSDLYSLGFFGFYLNDTENMLSLIEDKEEVAERRSKKFRNEKMEELQKNLNESSIYYKSKQDQEEIGWLKATLSRFREDRNAKNFFRICLVFLM